MLNLHDHNRAFRTENNKGGSGEKTAFLDEIEGMRANEIILCVIYLDHVLFRNVNTDEVKPAMRISMGWLNKNTPEYIVTSCDQPLNKTRKETTPIESGLVILKDTILAVFEVDCQILRSWKTIDNCLRGIEND